jgi:hypothetical protein
LWRSTLVAVVALLLLGVCLAEPSQISITRSKPAGPRVTSTVKDASVEGIECQTIYNWPSQLFRGYFPLSIRLENTNDTSALVLIEVESLWGSEDKVTRNVALDPGSVAQFELMLRARSRGSNTYSVAIESGGEDTQIGGCGPTESPDGAGRTCMIVSQKAQKPGTEEAWTDEWMGRVVAAPNPPFDGPFVVSTRTFDQLSSRWQAYTSLDSVVLDLTDGEPESADLEALCSWCRSGGKLIVVGVPAGRLAQMAPFGSYMQDRFRSEPGDGKEFKQAGLIAYQFGFGTLITQERLTDERELFDEDPKGDLPVAFVADQTEFVTDWARASFKQHSRQTRVQRTIEGFEDLPIRSLMMLIVLFAILMGPVNFIWLRKSKKPMLLLVTVPGIALVTSVGLLLYGVLSQGLDVKAITKSWAVLDQRLQLATHVEVREVFAGSAPDGGMRPQAGTVVMPESRYWHGSFRTEHMFISDQTNGTLLSGDYFPVRQPFSQMIYGDRSSRLRLDAKSQDGEVEVSNGLGEGITELLLRSPNGEYHYLDGSLAAGSSTQLKPGGGSTKVAHWKADLTSILGSETSGLAPGTYIANMNAGPLRDDCGVTVNEIKGEHVLLGILETDPGAWQ